MINRLEECILHLQHIISSAHKEQLHRLYQAYLYEKNCNHSLIQYYQPFRAGFEETAVLWSSWIWEQIRLTWSVDLEADTRFVFYWM
ncbi:unnamed protein product [Callosobruchus maculatus]|uniref:Uncharacterized protein n=1 Tax=Callosobruchus maculatus TaxID=64391 RepID=A0A653DIN1_CALMS|nr:unnamed protein product [Callosobruchus maculatus]